MAVRDSGEIKLQGILVRSLHRQIAYLIVAASSAWWGGAQAQTSSAGQEFRVVYRAKGAEQIQQEKLRSTQRAMQLSTSAGESVVHVRTDEKGAHTVRATRSMTRADAWAMAKKMTSQNPEILEIQPVDPQPPREPSRPSSAAN